MGLKISVIICAYTEDRWDQLTQAIESIRWQTLPAAETVVVIDYNPDLYHRLQEWDGSLLLLENQQEKGLSGARNTGVAAACGDLVAFLDDDATASPDWLALLNAQFRDDVLGVGGSVHPLWDGRKPGWFPDEFYWTVGCTYLGMPETAAPIRNPMGGAMVVRREIFTRVGGFRSTLGRLGSLPLGCEETEWCIRARQRSPQSHFVYEPRAGIDHHIPARRERFAYFCSRCYSEGISKALVVRLVGSSAGLSAERSYTFKTLPRGVLRGLKDALHGDLSGLGRAAAIILGLGFTTLGYLVGSLKWKAIRNPAYLLKKDPE